MLFVAGLSHGLVLLPVVLSLVGPLEQPLLGATDKIEPEPSEESDKRGYQKVEL